MKKININKNNGKCFEEHCPWKNTCSQFTEDSKKNLPDLLIDVDNGDIYCKVIDEKTPQKNPIISRYNTLKF